MHETINRLRAKKGDEGFTLIELLVVVVIIGVLVAIAVPVYLNYRKGAADKSAQSDVRGAVSAVEQYYTDNGNVYPADISAATPADGRVPLAAQNGGVDGVVTISTGTTFGLKNNPAASSGTAGYVLCATNSGGSGKVYIYSNTNGGSVKVSTKGNVADCLSSGS